MVYVSGERFVSDMVSALQQNRIDAFKAFYRDLDLLLVDDIQFLAGKERSQEEFFHVFNSMLESKNQLVMSCDRYPRDLKGLEDRLKSRFGWGLSVAVEPPDMETRVAILLSKAQLTGKTVPQDVAFSSPGACIRTCVNWRAPCVRSSRTPHSPMHPSASS